MDTSNLAARITELENQVVELEKAIQKFYLQSKESGVKVTAPFILINGKKRANVGIAGLGLGEPIEKPLG